MDQILASFASKDWIKFISNVKKAIRLAEKRDEGNGKPLAPEIRIKWKELSASVSKFEAQQDSIKNNFAFDFVEGETSHHRWTSPAIIMIIITMMSHDGS